MARNRMPIGITRCKSTSVNGKIIDAKCTVNRKVLSKEESIELAETMTDS